MDEAVNASGKTCWLLVETGHDGLVPIQYGEGAAAESEVGTEDWDIGSSDGANEAAGRDCEVKASRVAIALKSGEIFDRSSMFRRCYMGRIIWASACRSQKQQIYGHTTRMGSKEQSV